MHGSYQNEEPIPKKKTKFEAMLTRFSATSEKRRDENDVVLRNQQATIQNIEQKIRQLSRKFNQQLLGKLPSNTELNPNTHIKVATTRGRKIVAPLTALKNNMSSNEQISEVEKIQDEEAVQQPRRGED